MQKVQSNLQPESYNAVYTSFPQKLCHERKQQEEN